MAQSRLLSNNGAGTKFRFCQIDFSSAAYITVSTVKCIESSNGGRKNYGTGIKYDPIAGLLHLLLLNSNYATQLTSNIRYSQLNLATGAY